MSCRRAPERDWVALVDNPLERGKHSASHLAVATAVGMQIDERRCQAEFFEEDL